MTIVDKLLTPYSVKDLTAGPADIRYVVKKLLRCRPLFTVGWVQTYFVERKLEEDGYNNRLSDRLLQRMRVLRLIRFEKGYWHWTEEGKKCVGSL